MLKNVCLCAPFQILKIGIPPPKKNSKSSLLPKKIFRVVLKHICCSWPVENKLYNIVIDIYIYLEMQRVKKIDKKKVGKRDLILQHLSQD